MKKFYLLVAVCLVINTSILKCDARDEYYFYKVTDTTAEKVNNNIKKTIKNKDYKIIADDDKGNFYFIPVQLTLWDAVAYYKSRIRDKNFVIITSKQNGNDCYLALSKNHIAPRRKFIILRGISNKELRLTKINNKDVKTDNLKATLEDFKLNTQLSQKQKAEEIAGGNL